MHHPDRPAKVALFLLVFGLWVIAGESAPAPLQKREKASPRLPAGPCVMTWFGEKWTAHFHADGNYEASNGSAWRSHGSAWRGYWTLEGRRLSVVERQRPSHAPFAWSVELDATLRRSAAGGSFRLEEYDR